VGSGCLGSVDRRRTMVKAKKTKLSLTDIQQGDVLWATGPAGRRPYLVVTRTEMIPVLSAIVVAPVTRTIRRIPQCIPLTVADGMDVDCVATFDSLTVFDPTLFDERITTLPERRIHEICEALDALADC
jgi:mRNA interferase MazF